MPRTIGEYERKNQTSPVSPEGGIERLRQIEINNGDPLERGFRSPGLVRALSGGLPKPWLRL